MHTQTHFWQTIINLWCYTDRDSQWPKYTSKPASQLLLDRFSSSILKLCFWDPLFWKVLEAFREPGGLETGATGKAMRKQEQLRACRHLGRAALPLSQSPLLNLIFISLWYAARITLHNRFIWNKKEYFKKLNITESIKGLLMIYTLVWIYSIKLLFASDSMLVFLSSKDSNLI